MNQINLIGRLAQDIELRSTPNGTPVVSNLLAVPRAVKADETDFIPLTVYGRQAEILVQSTTQKGDRLAVEGRLQVRSYEAKDGSRRTAFEVVANRIEFIERRRKDDSAPAPAQAPAPQPYNGSPQYGTPAPRTQQYGAPPPQDFPPFEDEIPF